MRPPLWIAALPLVALSACGGESAQDTSTVALPPEPPSFPEPDAFDDDDFEDLAATPDTSVTADTLATSPEASGDATPAPTFEPFLREFKVALQEGGARRYAAIGSSLTADDLAALTADPAFQQKVLAAGPDRYRRYGNRRETYVVVGFDADGNIVPEDEAVTESGLGLVFDIVDGAYRLVRIERAG